MTPNPLHPLLRFAILAVGVSCGLLVHRQLGHLVAGVFSLLFLLGCLMYHLWHFKGGRYKPLIDVPLSGGGTASRVTVHGTKRDLSDLYPILDTQFEPMIFQQLLRTWVLVIFTVGMITIPFVAFFFMDVLWISSVSSILAICLGQLAAVAAWIFEQVFPVYLRIVPGRMDLMRFSSFRRNGKRTRSFDLRSVKISVRCDTKTIEIQEPGQVRYRINLFWFLTPYDLARGVLQGAVSTHPAPPLPDDELLG